MENTISLKNKINAERSLKQNIENILKQWSKQVRLEVPAATILSETELHNELPALLYKLSEIMSTVPETVGGERFSIELVDVCREHGEHRSKIAQYTLDQVITEYRILRRIVLEVLNEKKPLTPSEFFKILEVFDYGLTQASNEFTTRLGFEKSRLTEELASSLTSSRKETQAICQERNKTMKEMGNLQKENEQRDEFLSSLTHDLRTPITVAQSCTQLILKRPEQDLCRKLALKIKDAIERTD